MNYNVDADWRRREIAMAQSVCVKYQQYYSTIKGKKYHDVNWRHDPCSTLSEMPLHIPSMPLSDEAFPFVPHPINQLLSTWQYAITSLQSL